MKNTHLPWLLTLLSIFPMAAAAQRGPDPRVSVMATALRRGTASVRYDAVRSIALLKEKALLNRYIPLLQERLDDRHPLVRAETVKTLARLKLPMATQVLIRALKHNSVSVRYLATQALGKEGVAAALKPREGVARQVTGGSTRGNERNSSDLAENRQTAQRACRGLRPNRSPSRASPETS